MSVACPTCGEQWGVEFVGCGNCCSVCKDLDRQCARQENPRLYTELFGQYMKHLRSHRPKGLARSSNGAPRGAFAFTLTCSPSDGYTEEDMIKACKKIMSQRSCPVEKYAWFLEYGNTDERTHPHIHAMYETTSGGRVEAKHFKRAWPIWDESRRQGAGFRGGYHRPVRDSEKYVDYIAKDGGIGESSL